LTSANSILPFEQLFVVHQLFGEFLREERRQHLVRGGGVFFDLQPRDAVGHPAGQQLHGQQLVRRGLLRALRASLAVKRSSDLAVAIDDRRGDELPDADHARHQILLVAEDLADRRHRLFHPLQHAPARRPRLHRAFRLRRIREPCLPTVFGLEHDRAVVEARQFDEGSRRLLVELRLAGGALQHFEHRLEPAAELLELARG
jgi:hypothetical protein